MKTLVILLFITCYAFSSFADNNSNTLSDGIKEMVTQLSEQAKTGKKLTIAVTDFPDLDKNILLLSRFIAEEFITQLFQTGKFRVVERELLNKVMTEHKLAQDGLVDPNTAKELGKLVGADGVLTGSITDLGLRVKVNAKLISTETGEIIATAGSTIGKDDEVKKLMTVVKQPEQSSKSTGTGSAESKGEKVTNTPVEETYKSGLKGEYFNLPPNISKFDMTYFVNPVVTRIDQTISFKWEGSPAPKVSANYFGVVWQGKCI